MKLMIKQTNIYAEAEFIINIVKLFIIHNANFIHYRRPSILKILIRHSKYKKKMGNINKIRKLLPL